MEDIKIGGYTADEWEELANPAEPTEEQLKGLGIVREEENNTQSPQYEKLSKGETLVDMGTAALTEMSRAFVPKSMELNYTPRTQAADITKGITRFAWGIAGLSGGGWALKGVALATKVPKLINAAKGIAKLTGGEKLIRTGEKAGKLKKAGAGIANILTQGSIQGAILDYTLLDPNSGRLADLAGDTDNIILQWLQTNEEDSELTARFKNVIEGQVLSIGVNAAGTALAPVAKPLLTNLFSKTKFLKNSKLTQKQAETAANEIAQIEVKLNKIAETSDLITTVREIKTAADETGQDASELLVKYLKNQDIEEGQKILRVFEEGEDVFPHSNGTWSIKINKWEDAYKVTPEQYAEQVKSLDETGNFGISQMNEAVESTWRERGLVAGDGLLSKNAKERNDTAKAVLRYYKNKFGLGKTKIHLNFGDWSNIPDGRTTRYDNGEIFIQINSNSKDIYAALRSELEHARDLVKGEVPDQNIKHFARYEGINEAETAPYYIHKKSQSRADKQALQKTQEDLKAKVKQYETDGYKFLETKPTEGIGDKRYEIFDKQGNKLGFVEYSIDNNILDIGQVTNLTKRKIGKNGVKIPKTEGEIPSTPDIAEKLIDKLIAENPDKRIVWHAVTPDGTDFKQEFINKHPALKNRISGLTNPQEFDKETFEAYNNMRYTRRGSNERANSGEYNGSNVRETQRDITSDITGNSGKDSQISSKQIHNGDRTVVSGNSNGNTGGKAADTDIREGLNPNQLKPDFNTTEEAAEKVLKGEIKVETADDVVNIVNHIAEFDPEITGTTWKDIANDSEKLANLYIQADELGMRNELEEAFTLNDFKRMQATIRKITAAQKYKSTLFEKMLVMGENPPIEQIAPVMDMINAINIYTKEGRTAGGQFLEALGLAKKAIETFGSLRMSEAVKQGISTVSDLLEKTIRDTLNFTRAADRKKAVIQQLLDTDSELSNLLLTDSILSAKFDKMLDAALAKGDAVSAKDIESHIRRALMENDYQNCYNAAKLAKTPEKGAKVISNWCEEQGGFTSYYIHNLLSSPATLSKNIVSGALNTGYYPLKKIVGGILGGGTSLSKEGFNQYKLMSSNLQEAWELCTQAFLKGEGKLSNISSTMGEESGTLHGLREWNFDFSTPEGCFHALQNWHSVMTRAMGASDEFLSQLNYRSIVKAKALNQAEESLAKYNITNDKDINKLADKLFNASFDSNGKPLDVEAFAEAKEMLYQLPLNRTLKDPKSGEKVTVGNQTWFTDMGDKMNTLTNQNPFFKWLAPFLKTGFNIAEMNLEQLAPFFSPAYTKTFLSNTREGAIARAHTFLGYTGVGIAAIAAINGLVTGSAPSDPKERKALYETGWRPYSFRLNGKYYSYSGYEPLHTICGYAADAVNIFQYIENSEDEDKAKKVMAQTLAALTNAFLDKAAFRTGLQQISLLTDMAENFDEATERLAQQAQGLLPMSSMVRTISSLGERDNTSPTGYERIFNNYFNRGLGAYKRDVFGYRQDAYGYLVLNAGKDNADLPEYRELERLAEYGFYPTEISKTISGTRLKYTDFKNPETGRSIYDMMRERLSTVTLDGQTLQEAVRELVTSQDYKDMYIGVSVNGEVYDSSDPTKFNAIKDIFVMYNTAAVNEIIDEYGDVFIDRNKRTVTQAVEETEMQRMSNIIEGDLNQDLIDKITDF